MSILKSMMKKTNKSLTNNNSTTSHNKGNKNHWLKTSLINSKGKEESDNSTVLKPSKKPEAKVKSKNITKINLTSLTIITGQIISKIKLSTIKTIKDSPNYFSPKDLTTKCTKPTETKALQKDTPYLGWITESKD